MKKIRFDNQSLVFVMLHCGQQFFYSRFSTQTGFIFLVVRMSYSALRVTRKYAFCEMDKFVLLYSHPCQSRVKQRKYSDTPLAKVEYDCN